MRIVGTRICLRPLRSSDYASMLAALDDWPVDPAGHVTAARGIKHVDLWARDNLSVVRPALATSSFTETLMIGLKPWTPIGLVRYKVTGQQAKGLTEAINQDYRGHGYAKEANVLMLKYLFGAMALQRIELEAASWSPRMSKMLATRNYITRAASRVCSFDTNRIYTKHIITAAAWATRKVQPVIANADYTYIP